MARHANHLRGAHPMFDEYARQIGGSGEIVGNRA
jgi:hypothetical protein